MKIDFLNFEKCFLEKSVTGIIKVTKRIVQEYPLIFLLCNFGLHF